VARKIYKNTPKKMKKKKKKKKICQEFFKKLWLKIRVYYNVQSESSRR